MPQYSFEGLAPQVHARAFVAPTATLVGDVIVEAGASVWYGAVIRADYAPVVIRAGANIQDGAVLHGPPGLTTEVGRGATVAHNCVVHGAILGAECLVANGSIVLDGASIGAGGADRGGFGRGVRDHDPARSARGRRPRGGETTGGRVSGRDVGQGQSRGLRRTGTAPPHQRDLAPRLTTLLLPA